LVVREKVPTIPPTLRRTITISVLVEVRNDPFVEGVSHVKFLSFLTLLVYTDSKRMSTTNYDMIDAAIFGIAYRTTVRFE
jgi:hypothetical protein